jgi:hypothetical protein
MTIDCITKMIEAYDTRELKDFLQEISKEDFKKTSKWKYPIHWHVTSLFVGGNKSLKNDPILKNFQEDEKISIDFEGLIFVPNKIVTGICFPKTGVKNSVPHVTIMTNEWKPKDSNSIAEALFIDGKFKKEYESVFKNSDFKEKFVECINLKVGKEEVTAYLIKITPSYHFDGLNKYFQ